MITGLCSPGPKYALPTTFAKASIKTKHPTWGTGGSGAFKDGRLRSEEVRFHSRRHMRVFIGHYGPGPQYDVPSSIGGATGNYIASTQRLLDNCAVATGHRATLSAADVGGQPIFNTTPGSHADATRRGGTAPALGCTNFWRSNVMVQPHERLTGVLRKDAPPNVWTEHKASLGQTKLQEEMKASLRERYREVPKAPFRMVTDMLAEPCARSQGLKPAESVPHEERSSACCTPAAPHTVGFRLDAGLSRPTSARARAGQTTAATAGWRRGGARARFTR